jgi:tRNA A-37 threonylcarbamoyl transferase component Bud32
METVRICQQCRKPLPADAPEGLCPECLMRGALPSNASAPTSVESAARPSPPPPSPAELAPHFPQLEILEVLGQGGMGIVYKARQKHLDRLVALKILPPDTARDPAFAERFTREARSLARLNHPNIVQVFDFGQSGGFFFFLMEFMDGGNLRDLIVARRLSPREALAIVPKVCDALQYAHDEGIMHRDIKPENILLDTRGRVKIADFGLAKLLGREPANLTLTATGALVGTPRYMAPEQFERPAEVDHRADIYSLGVVFYEMLTGELPMGRFAPPSQKVEVDVRLDEVVLHTLEKEPARRYQHASEVKSDVENISSTGVPARPAPATMPQTAFAAPAVEDRDLESARQQVKGPAIALIVTSLVNWVGMFVALLAMWYFTAASPGTRPVMAMNAIAVLVLVLLTSASALILWGALKMQRLESLGMARLASVLAMVIGPGYLLGWPAGIWSLVVLARPEVKEALRRRQAAASQASGDLAAPRFSRKAIVGAAWAPFFFLALGAFFITIVPTTAPGDGAPAGGVALGKLIAVLGMLLGLTAPFATTILGALALHDIRHSRGRITGLPLALADALVYPLLLLTGAAVGVAALLITLVWAGAAALGLRLPPLGWGEMLIFSGALGVLASLPLHWFIIRKAWAAVRRPVGDTDSSPPVLPPTPRATSTPSEAGEKPRRVWPWLALAAGLVALLGLLALLNRPGDSIVFEEDHQARAQAASDWVFPFNVQAPKNHRVSFWIETWTNGVRTAFPGLRLAEWHDPPRGERFQAGVQIELGDRTSGSEGQPAQRRWSWIVKKRFSRSSRSGVCSDPLNGLLISDTSWGHVPRRTPQPGEEVTLLRLRGAREQLVGPIMDTAHARQADVVIELKARVDPVPEHQLQSNPRTGPLQPSLGEAEDAAPAR